ncbi:surface protease GP63 [Trypanosoma cruzi]|nr:surface protease GP63 [Trypanosoma cruzi]
MMRRSGPLSTAVVREVPRKGQGAMQAYTVATQDDDSGWEPIRMAVSTEHLERGTNKRKYCEEGEDECYNALGHRVSCKAEHFLTEEKKQSHTGKILPGAVKRHAERLLVKPTGGTITVPRAMNGPCSQFTVPTRHKSDGVPNADFIIYAAARPSGTDSRAVWAATCNTLTDSRPSIGAMNFDPKCMTDTAWGVRVAAHEIAHALGFSQESMREKSLVKKRERSVRGTHRRMVAGNHVQEKAKAHFGFDSRGHGAGGRRWPSGKRNPSLEGTPRAGRADGSHSWCRLLHGSDDGDFCGYGILPRELEHGGADELGPPQWLRLPGQQVQYNR